jgi:hypothetical protein
MTGLRMNWLTTPVRMLRMLLELINELSFTTTGEPTRDHYFELFVYWSVSSVATGTCLPNSCLATDYSASTRCHANAYQFRSNQSAVSDTRLANRVLARSCLAMDFWLHYSGFQSLCHNIIISLPKYVYRGNKNRASNCCVWCDAWGGRHNYNMILPCLLNKLYISCGCVCTFVSVSMCIIFHKKLTLTLQE